MRRTAGPIAAVAVLLSLALGSAPAGARIPAWTEVASGTTDTITAIEYQADDRLWFATGNGKIFQRVGGAFVQRLDAPGVVFTDLEFQPGAGTVGLAVGTNGSVYRSADAGATWANVNPGATPIPSSKPDCSASAPLGDVGKVAFARSDVAYLFGGPGQIARSSGANVGAAGSWTDANRDTAPNPDVCRLQSDSPVTGAVFVAGSDPIRGYFQTTNFGELFFTGDNLAGTPVKKNSGLNGFETAHRIVADPANPNRQWGISVDQGGNGSYYKRTEDGWSTSLDWKEGNPSKRQPASTFDITARGGTVLSAGSAGQIRNSVDGATFFFVDDAALPTQDWRSVGLASATKGAVGGTNGKLVLTDQADSVPDLVPPTGTISGPDSTTANAPATFDAVVADEQGGSGIDPASLQWTVTGLPGQSGPRATFTFPQPGAYAVKLTFRDLDGNAAEATKSVTVGAAVLPAATLPSKAPAVKAKRKGGKLRIKVSGRIGLPTGVSKAAGCSGKVKIALKRKSKKLGSGTAKVTKSCHYSKTISVRRSKVGRAKTLKLSVRFGGNAAVRSVSSSYSVRVR